MRMKAELVPRVICLGGLSTWVSIAALNNFTDPETNYALLRAMFSMSLLRADGAMGNGLEWRAIEGDLAPAILPVIAFVQLLIALGLWWATAQTLRAAWTGSWSQAQRARRTGIYALCAFLSLWFFFACGGFWFAYWIKQGVVQQVHMTLIIIGLVSLVLVSAPVPPDESVQ
jgi:predicted small integral membrane protein